MAGFAQTATFFAQVGLLTFGFSNVMWICREIQYFINELIDKAHRYTHTTQRCVNSKMVGTSQLC